MRFWDTSALIPLIVGESQSAAMEALYFDDPDLIVWWATRVEIQSALARRKHSGDTQLNLEEALAQRDDLMARAREVSPSESVRGLAERLVTEHRLRAADALQLAAALVVQDHLERPLLFVTLDVRLGQAARAEGLQVLGL